MLGSEIDRSTAAAQVPINIRVQIQRDERKKRWLTSGANGSAEFAHLLRWLISVVRSESLQGVGQGEEDGQQWESRDSITLRGEFIIQ